MTANVNRGTGHRNRLRARFLSAGLEQFSDEEVVEFLLSLGTPRRDVKLPAREALVRFKNISGVLSASLEELTGIRGIGTRNALYLKFVHDVAGRYLKDRAIGKPFFGSSRDIFDYLFHSMRDLTREVFRVMFLNRKNELIGDEDLFTGTLTGSAVYPREIMTHALQRNAAALVCVHNHPSGDPSPSPEDRRLTRDLVWTGKLLGVQALDHIVIGHNTYFSFADDGLIRRFSAEYGKRFLDP
jgi:DNA repair protein RadC